MKLIWTFSLIPFLFSQLQLEAQTNGICPDTITTTVLEYSEFGFEINGIDGGGLIQWDLGDGTQLIGGDSLSHVYMFGSYVITATFFDLDCSTTDPITISTVIEVQTCGLEIEYTELDSGLFNFAAISMPDVDTLLWDFGDGTQMIDTLVVNHNFDDGEFLVCAEYVSEFCPDTVFDCVSIFYEEPVDCSAEFSYEPIPNDWDTLSSFYTLVQAQNVFPDWTYNWDFGVGPILGSPDTLIENVGELQPNFAGVNACLVVNAQGCSDTVCHQIMNCINGSYRVLVTGYYNEILGNDIFEFSLNQGKLYNQYFSSEFITSGEPLEFQFCALNEYCPFFHYNGPNNLDSVSFVIYYNDEILPLLDTLVTINSNGTLYWWAQNLIHEDCIIINVEETISSFSIYPNPANDWIRLDNAESLQCCIFNMQGEKLYDRIQPPFSSIDVSDLPMGTYVLHGTTDRRLIHQKIQIIR